MSHQDPPPPHLLKRSRPEDARRNLKPAIAREGRNPPLLFPFFIFPIPALDIERRRSPKRCARSSSMGLSRLSGNHPIIREAEPECGDVHTFVRFSQRHPWSKLWSGKNRHAPAWVFANYAPPAIPRAYFTNKTNTRSIPAVEGVTSFFFPPPSPLPAGGSNFSSSARPKSSGSSLAVPASTWPVLSIPPRDPQPVLVKRRCHVKWRSAKPAPLLRRRAVGRPRSTSNQKGLFRRRPLGAIRFLSPADPRSVQRPAARPPRPKGLTCR